MDLYTQQHTFTCQICARTVLIPDQGAPVNWIAPSVDTEIVTVCYHRTFSTPHGDYTFHMRETLFRLCPTCFMNHLVPWMKTVHHQDPQVFGGSAP